MKPRDVPTVWTKKISLDLEPYVRNGYEKRESFYDPQEIRQVREEAKSLWATCPKENLVFEKDEITVRSVYGLFQILPALEKVLVTPKLVQLAESILGSGVYIHQAKLNYKNANSGGGFFWHSDYTVWNWEDGMPKPRSVLFMIPLDRISLDNGPLMIVAGSHNYYDEFLGAEEERYQEYGRDVSGRGHCTPDQLEMLDFLTLDTFLGNPGDLFYFDSNALHASQPNLSSQNRLAIILSINSIHNKLEDPRSGKPHRPDCCSNKNFKRLI